jgi:hypothetical protein
VGFSAKSGKISVAGILRRHGGGKADFDAELIRLMRLAFADALHLRGVKRVNLWRLLPLLLDQHAVAQG